MFGDHSVWFLFESSFPLKTKTIQPTILPIIPITAFFYLSQPSFNGILDLP